MDKEDVGGIAGLPDMNVTAEKTVGASKQQHSYVFSGVRLVASADWSSARLDHRMRLAG